MRFRMRTASPRVLRVSAFSARPGIPNAKALGNCICFDLSDEAPLVLLICEFFYRCRRCAHKEICPPENIGLLEC